MGFIEFLLAQQHPIISIFPPPTYKDFIPHPSHHHQHHRHRRHHHQEEWNMGSGKTISFLWLLAFSSLLYVVFFPKPYKVTPLKALNQREDPKQKPTNSHDAIKGEMGCDFSKGKWVRDSGGPAYTNTTCQTLPESKCCVKYGKDPDYLNWRWKPNDCELPRFDARMFLDIVRGKRMAFAGDSVARNQLESLLCLLSQVTITGSSLPSTLFEIVILDFSPIDFNTRFMNP